MVLTLGGWGGRAESSGKGPVGGPCGEGSRGGALAAALGGVAEPPWGSPSSPAPIKQQQTESRLSSLFWPLTLSLLT
jgi:hypothetical protein